MIRLKVATADDLDETVALVSRFCHETPYDISFDPQKIHDVVSSIINGKATEGIAILAQLDDKPVGAIIGVVQPFLLSHDNVALELMWWMHPNYRKGRTAFKLLEAFEHWGKHIAGCTLVQMSTVQELNSEKLRKFYSKLGYKSAELSFYKKL